MEVKVKTIKCPTCGGTLQFDPGTQVTICSYCGNTSIIEAKDQGELNLSVDKIIPFQISKEKFVSIVQNWLGKGFFARKDLVTNASIDKIHGIYLPFFAYDILWSGRIEAEIGYDKWVKYYDSTTKQQREKRETDWHPYQTEGEMQFQVIGFASKAIKEKYYKFCESACTSLLKKVKEFRKEYLLGFVSEPFNIGDEQIFKERVEKSAWKKVDAYVHERLLGKGDTQRNIQYSPHLKYSAHSVYFPFWLATYKYKGKTYEIVVDGCTGQITGSKPVSPTKILTTLVLLIGIPLLCLVGILVGFNEILISLAVLGLFGGLIYLLISVIIRRSKFIPLYITGLSIFILISHAIFIKDDIKNAALNESEKKAIITAKSANIRNGPGANYDVIVTLTGGKEVRVISMQDEWLSIEYDRTGAGWIHKSLIQYIDSLK